MKRKHNPLTTNEAARRGPALVRMVVNRTGTTRKATLNGRDYTVVPMIMITEGVHAGSNGPLYYPADELSRTPAVWDHKPVVLPDHPVNNEGEPVSACRPDVLERYGIGLIMNTRYEPGTHNKPGRLKAEAWLEDSRLEAADPRLLTAIEEGRTLELSTGVFTDNAEEKGKFRNKAYDAIARNYRPDHLAVLMDKKGACAVKDGAGFLRLNHGIPGNHLTTNRTSKLSFNAITQQLSTLLRERHAAANPDNPVGLWVEDVYDDYVVFCNDAKLYRADYSVTGNTVALDGTSSDEHEVQRVTEYRDAETNAFVGNAGEPANPLEVVMTKTEKVNFLVKNAGWTEADRKFLSSASDKQLDTLVSNAKKPPANGDGDAGEEEEDEELGDPNKVEPGKSGKGATKPGDTTGPTKTVPSPTPSKEQQEEAEQKRTDNAAIRTAISEMTPQEFMAILPAPVRNSVAHGMQLAAQQRANMIESITANSDGIYTKEELEKMDTEPLAKLAALARASRPTDNAQSWQEFARAPRFDGAAGAAPVNNAAGEPEPLESLVINWEEDYANRR